MGGVYPCEGKGVIFISIGRGEGNPPKRSQKKLKGFGLIAFLIFIDVLSVYTILFICKAINFFATVPANYLKVTFALAISIDYF